jgi:hypothetical protein
VVLVVELAADLDEGAPARKIRGVGREALIDLDGVA